MLRFKTVSGMEVRVRDCLIALIAEGLPPGMAFFSAGDSEAARKYSKAWHIMAVTGQIWIVSKSTAERISSEIESDGVTEGDEWKSA